MAGESQRAEPEGHTARSILSGAMTSGIVRQLTYFIRYKMCWVLEASFYVSQESKNTAKK